MSVTEAGASAGRGRPPILSEQAIVEAALSHLTQRHPLMDLSMAQVARDLSVSATALYRYFPTRDQLLRALSDRIFAEFVYPDLALPWVEQLRVWQDSLAMLFERCPSLTRLMGWGEEIAPAWFKIQMPPLRVMHDQGLRGTDLVEISTWFLSGTVGLLRTHMIADSELQRPSHLIAFETSLPLLTPEERALVDETLPFIALGDSDRIVREGLDALVDRVVKRVAALA
ncbi:TetR/AcrR family transcriptional regulator [Flavisphingomonas formosensis]|uniref:TetR/AcrR family transcriptional regulator n=1 Tax=Flavisphingomonas formosensis TaxID=861534 RepID=UPI0012FBB76E|nr:TetR/AcrR family transcriptional regulator [Sphingomonas formosensis]